MSAGEATGGVNPARSARTRQHDLLARAGNLRHSCEAPGMSAPAESGHRTASQRSSRCAPPSRSFARPSAHPKSCPSFTLRQLVGMVNNGQSAFRRSTCLNNLSSMHCRPAATFLTNQPSASSGCSRKAGAVSSLCEHEGPAAMSWTIHPCRLSCGMDRPGDVCHRMLKMPRTPRCRRLGPIGIQDNGRTH